MEKYGSDINRGTKTTALRMGAVLLTACVILSSCAPYARYVIINDHRDGIDFDYAGQRYICLSNKDAENMEGVIALRKKSDIRMYMQTRKDTHNQAEDVLAYLVIGDYKKSKELLQSQWHDMPEYLRLLLRADLASETETKRKSSLVKLYQEAYDVQPCDINREIIKFRIRQLRYGQ